MYEDEEIMKSEMLWNRSRACFQEVGAMSNEHNHLMANSCNGQFLPIADLMLA